MTKGIGPHTLPPDRGHVATEQRHARSMDFDALSVIESVDLMIDDHRAVLDALHAAREPLAKFIEELVPRISGGGRLIYLGAGTSGRLGVLDASECPPTFHIEPGQIVGLIAGGDSALRTSSEGMEDDPEGARGELERLNVNDRDTVLGIAAGGTTPYVLGGIAIASERGAMTGLLTCSGNASPRAVDHVIVLNTGAELLTGSTRLKAGTATKIALNIITTTLFARLGKTFGNLMVDLRATNDKLADRAIRILIDLFPNLSREEAAEILSRASGRLKAAIVMHGCGVDLPAASGLLTEHGGRLRACLDRASGC